MKVVLKKINLKAFINSMKLTWLRRVVISNSPWQSVISTTINFKELLVFGKCYTDSTKKKTNNRFWFDVISANSEILQLISEDTEHFILSSTIFHNNKITIGNKPIYIKEWGQKRVRNINDLIHETGAFLLQEEFERIYNIKTNFVQFLGLKQ